MAEMLGSVRGIKGGLERHSLRAPLTTHDKTTPPDNALGAVHISRYAAFRASICDRYEPFLFRKARSSAL
jgi:hypothetical protein